MSENLTEITNLSTTPVFPNKITVVGNIGVGKTTTIDILQSNITNSESIFERFEENEHLSKFYEELKKNPNSYNQYSYPTLKSFLQLRFETWRKLNKYKTFIVDRCLFEDRHIFFESHKDSNF